MLSLLFAHLRQAYPGAEICVTLLTIHKDEYVVQAAIRLGEGLLANALAADRIIETAEDRACQRALAHLGLELTNDAATDAATPATSAPAAKPRPPAPPPHSAELSPERSPTPSHPDPPRSSGEPESVPDEEPAPLEPVSPGTQPSGAAPSPGNLPENHSLNSPGNDLSPNGATRSEERPQAAPVDLSDVIVQTDVELRRLGWGVSQGRDFLESTYGKRSRHDLTDEELLEFLLYLESQPSPSQ